MSIHIKLSTTLRQYVPDYVPAQGLDLQVDNKTAREIAENLGLPLSEIKFIMLNGRLGDLSDVIKNGDRLAYFPAVGGG